MKKQDLLSLTGNMQQLAYARPLMFTDGRAAGVQACEVKNGELFFRVLADRCMDIEEFSYKGQTINFLTKPGLTGRINHDLNDQEGLRSIMGGFLFMCGFENVGDACTTADGKNRPFHGSLRYSMAEHFSSSAVWQDDDYVITVSGEMRESALFSENLTLRREIQTKLGEKSIIIRDEIENQAFKPEAMMLLYHFNFGYPLLSPNTRIIIPSIEVTPRDAISALHAENWHVMDEPKPNEPEYVFIHKLKADKNGNTFVAVINDNMQMGVLIEFNKKYLPNLTQWKSIASGDYVLGLEPTNSTAHGSRDFHEKENSVHMLEPFEKECIEHRITILDGKEKIDNFVEKH